MKQIVTKKPRAIKFKVRQLQKYILMYSKLTFIRYTHLLNYVLAKYSININCETSL